MWLISSVIFLKKPFVPYQQSNFQAPPIGLYGQPQQQALPPQQSVPAQQYTPGAGSWRDTNDLQPSVTESATKILKDEERHR
jgi:hypothetical protein